VHAKDEIMLISDRGVLIRTRVSEIREMGRATQGVTLIGLDEGSKLSGVQRIAENDAQNSDPEADPSDELGNAEDTPKDESGPSNPDSNA
jgi:DNA gyrase subunit A